MDLNDASNFRMHPSPRSRFGWCLSMFGAGRVMRGVRRTRVMPIKRLLMQSRLSLFKYLIAILFLNSTTPGQNENQNYLPLSKADLAKRFTVRFTGTVKPGESSTKNLPAGPRGAVLRKDPDGELLVSGDDRSGRNWSVRLGGYCIGFETYVADLDRNGLKDLILRIPTCGNGLAPSSHIVTLTFDSLGRPVPFEADGYFQTTNDGIADIVDLNSDGKAELIYMNFSDGYWITNLYRVSSARWERVKGTYAGYTFPLFTRFTFKPNHSPTTPKRGRRPFAPDLSNKVSKESGHLHLHEWANTSSSGDFSMLIGNSKTGSKKCSPDSWYASLSVVIETRKERRIVFLSAKKEIVKAFLDEIVVKRHRVNLYGRRRSDRCSPEIIWADDRRAAS